MDPKPRGVVPAVVRGAVLCLALAAGLGAGGPAALAGSTANELFGAADGPTRERDPEVIGTYTRGCLRGAVELPVDGPDWQVMRLSRNRNWGHPSLVRFVQRFAAEARRDGWPGLLIGDMAQPRGGPMRNGHASHQLGLDVDVWLMPRPSQPFSPDERESVRAISMVKQGRYAVDPQRWGPSQAALIRRAARSPEVARVFVNPGIKKALCATASSDEDRGWLGKIRPWYGHDEHFHVRLRCPAGEEQCRDQNPPPRSDGCGGELAHWLRQTPYVPKVLSKPARPLSLASLPAACGKVLKAP